MSHPNDEWHPNTEFFLDAIHHMQASLAALLETDHDKEDWRWLIRRLIEISFLPRLIKEAFSEKYRNNPIQGKYRELYHGLFQFLRTLSRVHPDAVFQDTAVFRTSKGLRYLYEKEGAEGILWEEGGWIVEGTSLWLCVEDYAKVAGMGQWRKDGWDWMEGGPREHYEVMAARSGKRTKVRQNNEGTCQPM